MDQHSLENSLKEIFVANVVNEQDEYVTPLNAGELTNVLLASARCNREARGKLVDSLREVLSAAREGRINLKLYNSHSFAINSVARDATSQRWWGSGLDYLCIQEDEESKPVPIKKLARFPHDGNYGGISNSGETHVNILDEPSKQSAWEGTLFHQSYDSGYLRSIRIFHQGHRNSLKITTIEQGDLMEAIEQAVLEYDKLPEVKPVSLPLTKQEYRKRMDAFNQEFGDVVQIKVLNTERKSILVAELAENPQKVAEWFVQTAPEQGINGYANRGVMTYTIGERQNHGSVDLFLETHLTQPWSNTQFDSIKHADARTVIMPYLEPRFSIPFLTMYVKGHSEQ